LRLIDKKLSAHCAWSLRLFQNSSSRLADTWVTARSVISGGWGKTRQRDVHKAAPFQWNNTIRLSIFPTSGGWYMIWKTFIFVSERTNDDPSFII
jgi:hypothetical protein